MDYDILHDSAIQFSLSSIVSWMADFEQELRGDKELPSGILAEYENQEEALEARKKSMMKSVLSYLQNSPSAFFTFRKDTNNLVKYGHRQFKLILQNAPTDLYEPVFSHWRTYLERAIAELEDEISDRGIGDLPEQDDSEAVREEARKIIHTITKLEQDRDAETEKNPSQADLIDKIYRQAIDRIREQQ